MRCAGCGAESREKARFCTKCGTVLEKEAPQMHFGNDREKSDEAMKEAIRANTVESYERFISRFPSDCRVDMARAEIARMRAERANNRQQKEYDGRASINAKTPPSRWNALAQAFGITLFVGSAVLFAVAFGLFSVIAGSPAYRADGECDRCGASAHYEVTEYDPTTGQTETVNELCFLHAVTTGGFDRWGSGTGEIKAAKNTVWVLCYIIPFAIVYKLVRRYGKEDTELFKA